MTNEQPCTLISSPPQVKIIISMMRILQSRANLSSEMKNEPAPWSNVCLQKIYPQVCFIVIILPHFNKVYEKIRKDAAIICNREPKVTRCCTCLRCSHQFFLNCKLPKDCTRRPGILLFHLSRFSNQQSNAAKRCHDGSRLGEHILFHLSVGLSIHNS